MMASLNGRFVGETIPNDDPQAEAGGPEETSDEDMQLVLQCFRFLVADLCQQHGMGHAGGAMGMAAIGVALFRYAMTFAPLQPDWFNRDRFVLSNGHACLFQYINLHLTGYKSMTWNQLLSYHAGLPDTLCPGHPEIEHEGIEVTTGPLGQGIANAVGLAIATKHLAATYNRPGFEIIDNHTWCTVSDADLQEGVACEAFSYAGHLQLNNLTVIYDNNSITCDGSVDLTNTEDVDMKMRAQGWDVVDVFDGVNDVRGITAALSTAKDPSRTKPLFVNVRTVIAVGSAAEGKASAHGGPIGAEDIREMKRANGWDPNRVCHVPLKVRDFYATVTERGSQWTKRWSGLLERFRNAYPDLASKLQDRIDGRLRGDWVQWMPKSDELPLSPLATRKSNTLVMSKVFEHVPQFVVGTADLTPSVGLTWNDYENFNSPTLRPTVGKPGSYRGRYIHFGVREHAMVAISNGIAAFSPGAILPVTTGFMMFYLYAAAAVRMGALQHLHVIHVATHDSIGLGEDGPTHQPIEHAAFFKAMPNMLYIRPADNEEVAGAWKVAVAHKAGPAIISTSRQSVPQNKGSSQEGVERGAYVIHETADAEVTLIGAGAELSFAIDICNALALERPPIKARVVSFPSNALFLKQSRQYQREVLRRHEGIPAIIIEPYSSLGWERWTDAGFTMSTYGHSLPVPQIYQHFGYTTENMIEKIKRFLRSWTTGSIFKGEWTELREYG